MRKANNTPRRCLYCGFELPATERRGGRRASTEREMVKHQASAHPAEVAARRRALETVSAGAPRTV